jgi:hypothetical protein
MSSPAKCVPAVPLNQSAPQDSPPGALTPLVQRLRAFVPVAAAALAYSVNGS